MKEGECDSFRARADLYGKQVCYCTNTANRFSTVQYRCLFVLLFGQYSLQLDNNVGYSPVLAGEY